MKDECEYKILSFPSSRIGTIVIGKAGLHKHHIAALLEFDVMQARKNAKKTEKLKFAVDRASAARALTRLAKTVEKGDVFP